MVDIESHPFPNFVYEPACSISPVRALPEVVWNLFVGLCIVSFDYTLLENVKRPRSALFRILGCETLSSSVFSRDNGDLNVLVVAVLLGAWRNLVT